MGDRRSRVRDAPRRSSTGPRVRQRERARQSPLLDGLSAPETSRRPHPTPLVRRTIDPATHASFQSDTIQVANAEGRHSVLVVQTASFPSTSMNETTTLPTPCRVMIGAGAHAELATRLRAARSDLE